MDGLVGREIYECRVTLRLSWLRIGMEFGLSDQGARKMAYRYASGSGKPWPVERATKGGAIYSARRVMSWVAISKRYGDDISSCKRLAYKYARRRGLSWPVQ